MTDTSAKLNRLVKWRTLFAGWQLGTRAKGDPEGDAVRDHREATLLLRAEVSALVATLVHAQVITTDDFVKHLGDEADMLQADLEKRFPGVTATDTGLTFSKATLPWMKGWKP